MVLLPLSSNSLPVDFFFPTYLFLPWGWFCHPGRTIIHTGWCGWFLSNCGGWSLSLWCNYSLSFFFPFPTGWFLLSCWFLPNGWIHLTLSWCSHGCFCCWLSVLKCDGKLFFVFVHLPSGWTFLSIDWCCPMSITWSLLMLFNWCFFWLCNWHNHFGIIVMVFPSKLSLSFFLLAGQPSSCSSIDCGSFTNGFC